MLQSSSRPPKYQCKASQSPFAGGGSCLRFIKKMQHPWSPIKRSAIKRGMPVLNFSCASAYSCKRNLSEVYPSSFADLRGRAYQMARTLRRRIRCVLWNNFGERCVGIYQHMLTTNLSIFYFHGLTFGSAPRRASKTVFITLTAMLWQIRNSINFLKMRCVCIRIWVYV